MFEIIGSTGWSGRQIQSDNGACSQIEAPAKGVVKQLRADSPTKWSGFDIRKSARRGESECWNRHTGKRSDAEGYSDGRQARIRRYDQRGDQAEAPPSHAPRRQEGGQGDFASVPLAAGALGPVAAGDAHALEAQGMEIEGLVLGRHYVRSERDLSRQKSGARLGA